MATKARQSGKMSKAAGVDRRIRDAVIERGYAESAGIGRKNRPRIPGSRGLRPRLFL